jgi:hypothetical protein
MPGYDAAEVTKRVARRWAFRFGWLPWPRFTVRCPCCHEPDVQLKSVQFGRHPGTIPGRADVHIKCCVCSHLWTYGIPISNEVYKLAVKPDGSRAWDWREIEAKLTEEIPV